MKKLMYIFMALVIVSSVSPVFAHDFPSINIFQEENGLSGSKKEAAGPLMAFPSLAARPLEWVNESAGRYDVNNCNTIIGLANMERTQKVNINTAKVDFADDPHFGGSPGGDAVICWATNGRVAVKGRLFSDNLNQQIAIAQIKFHSAGGGWSGYTTYSTTLAGGWVASKVVSLYTAPGGFDKVRIRLKRTTYSALGPATTVINSWTFDR